MATNKPADTAVKQDVQGTRIKWDDASMRSSYANVCNVTSTREEVVMLFGINQAWNRGQKEVTIQLTDRIIISPYAAKRLSLLLHDPALIAAVLYRDFTRRTDDTTVVAARVTN